MKLTKEQTKRWKEEEKEFKGQKIIIHCKKCRLRYAAASNVDSSGFEGIGGYCHYCEDYTEGVLGYIK